MKNGWQQFSSVLFLVLCAILYSVIVTAAEERVINSSEPPLVPVGLDAYRMWDRWAYQRIGVRAYMQSTYDRTGGNRRADASHFLYQVAEDFNVTLDVQGPGILYFARYNAWHGSPWYYEVDGVSHIVQETNTSNPLVPTPDATFLPEELFPRPLTFTWAESQGADLMWVPIPFEERFRMAYGRTFYGTGYYIYHRYVGGLELSQPITAWDGKTPPAEDVLDLIGRAGTDIVSEIDSLTGEEVKLFEQSGIVSLGAHDSVTVFETSGLPRMIRSLEFAVPRDKSIEFGRAWLRITWDNRDEPSVCAPVALFFGAGTLYNRDNVEYLVKAFPVNIRFDDEYVHLACYFPMPYFHSAKIELINEEDVAITDITWRVRSQDCKDPLNHVGYFHATFKDHENPEIGRDLVLLDTREVEGGGDWSGHIVGTTIVFTDQGQLWTLEGDPRLFFDDALSPQVHGTGSEEWGGGGDYFRFGQRSTLPLAGHPVGAPGTSRDSFGVATYGAKNKEDLIHSLYRFLLADLMPFGKNALICLEHGAQNESSEHYRSLTYWYGLPGASLVKTDELNIGDFESERLHDYVSVDASEPYEVTSRYDGVGPDALRHWDEGPEANPEHFVEFEFEADPNRTYYIWVRGKNLDGDLQSDAFWIQFDDKIGTAELGEAYNHAKGFGNWLDRFDTGPNTYAWCSGIPQAPPQSITFEEGGIHRLRIQPRNPTHYIDQIWLSASQDMIPAFFEPVEKRHDEVAGEIFEIVLDANDVTAISGAISLVEDPDSSTGLVIKIDGSKEIIPAHTDVGRYTTGSSEFTVQIAPDNLGVLLRRKLDWSFPNQRARVYVARDWDRDEEDIQWVFAGIWYTAGSNRCVYVSAGGELGPPVREVVVSNRRFKEDEFLISRELTEGCTSIRIRIEYAPEDIPLFPGDGPSQSAWTEFRYYVYSFVMPVVNEGVYPIE